MTVDNAIIDASRSEIELPPPEGLLTAKQIERAVVKLDVAMQDEKAVASFYDKTTATFCAPVASTLALHPRTLDWLNLVVWTQSGNSAYAIADGFLRIVSSVQSSDKHRAIRAMLENAITDETRVIYRSLRGHFPSLATLEMKNLAAGRYEVIRAIPNLENVPFDWPMCEVPNCVELKTRPRELRRVADVGRVVGPDAENTPWRLPLQARRNPRRASTSAQSKHSTLGLGLQIGISGSRSTGKNVANKSAKRKRGGVNIYDNNARSSVRV
jgi:hypothetical protein